MLVVNCFQICIFELLETAEIVGLNVTDWL